LNTFDANLKLGFHQDERSFDMAVEILNHFEIKSIELITNNPEKIHVFDHTGIEVISRRALNIQPSSSNSGYLQAKKDIMGHML
jgi:GTP cyclohydrolase II